ncbi:cold-shock protein [Shewanella sp. UCD-KL12]|uniref:cold-shock protein n=1 Tax=Shewanella sp. UCD-KL12 TaxID=1917163 RepID=UPI000970F80F|nr:hypothetical protein [Shewanella sp. UCD-KL12]
MQSPCLTGKLVRWNDDKGIGVIQPDDSHHDVATLYGPASEQMIAINLSALQHMHRRPRLGDQISFNIETKLDSKLIAFNASIDGVTACSARKGVEKAVAVNGVARQSISATSVLSRLALIAALITAGSYTYQYLF